MRFRTMATYRGVPYEAGVGPSGSDVVLFAACPPPEELGFEPATGHWRKRVIRAEVDALWESRPVGTFRGEPCIVLDDLGDRLHIAYLGLDAQAAARLGYWQVDRGVFELLTPREDVTGLTEERVDKPLRMAPPPAASAVTPSYPYGPPASLPPPAPPGGPLTPPGGPLTPPGGPLTPPPPGEPASAGPLPGAGGRAGAPKLGGHAATEYPASGPASTGTSARHATGGDYLAAGPGWGTAGTPPPPAGTGGRAARRQRVSTREIFCELADLAAIPRTEYALETEVDGALCLLPAREGFEVFVSVDGARHESRTFADEEAAYFYLFGVLAADAIRNGLLVPATGPLSTPHAGLSA